MRPHNCAGLNRTHLGKRRGTPVVAFALIAIAGAAGADGFRGHPWDDKAAQVKNQETATFVEERFVNSGIDASTHLFLAG
jgi:hypothetical protein